MPRPEFHFFLTTQQPEGDRQPIGQDYRKWRAARLQCGQKGQGRKRHVSATPPACPTAADTGHKPTDAVIDLAA